MGTAIIFRKSSFPVILLASVATLEYVYFLFAFPVEEWHYHRRALSTNKPYSQFLRDSYRTRFPDSFKSAEYQKIDARQKAYYEGRLERLVSRN